MHEVAIRVIYKLCSNVCRADSCVSDIPLFFINLADTFAFICHSVFTSAAYVFKT